MTMVAVMYPSAGGDAFDEKYYMGTHIPMVRKHWDPMGLSDLKVMRGVAGPDGAPAPYMMVALLTFSSMDAFKAAASAHGKEIFADIPNFTSAKPIVQFSEAVG